MADSLPEEWGGSSPCEPRRLHAEVSRSVLEEERAGFPHACKRSRQISGAGFPGIWMFDYPRSSYLLFTSLTCLLFK